MKPIITVAVILSALVGCAAFKQGLKDATEGIKPNPAALPEGEGWFCYAATQKEWSGCNRTQEACHKDRDQAQRLYQVDTFDFSKWGKCLPASQVFCATYESTDISTGKMENFFGCFPDELGCGAWANNPPSGALRMSSCGMFK
jgi:hypothetical protein